MSKQFRDFLRDANMAKSANLTMASNVKTNENSFNIPVFWLALAKLKSAGAAVTKPGFMIVGELKGALPEEAPLVDVKNEPGKRVPLFTWRPDGKSITVNVYKWKEPTKKQTDSADRYAFAEGKGYVIEPGMYLRASAKDTNLGPVGMFVPAMAAGCELSLGVSKPKEGDTVGHYSLYINAVQFVAQAGHPLYTAPRETQVLNAMPYGNQLVRSFRADALAATYPAPVCPYPPVLPNGWPAVFGTEIPAVRLSVNRWVYGASSNAWDEPYILPDESFMVGPGQPSTLAAVSEFSTKWVGLSALKAGEEKKVPNVESVISLCIAQTATLPAPDEKGIFSVYGIIKQKCYDKVMSPLQIPFAPLAERIAMPEGTGLPPMPFEFLFHVDAPRCQIDTDNQNDGASLVNFGVKEKLVGEPLVLIPRVVEYLRTFVPRVSRKLLLDRYVKGVRPAYQPAQMTPRGPEAACTIDQWKTYLEESYGRAGWLLKPMLEATDPENNPGYINLDTMRTPLESFLDLPEGEPERYDFFAFPLARDLPEALHLTFEARPDMQAYFADPEEAPKCPKRLVPPADPDAWVRAVVEWNRNEARKTEFKTIPASDTAQHWMQKPYVYEDGANKYRVQLPLFAFFAVPKSAHILDRVALVAAMGTAAANALKRPRDESDGGAASEGPETKRARVDDAQPPPPPGSEAGAGTDAAEPMQQDATAAAATAQ